VCVCVCVDLIIGMIVCVCSGVHCNHHHHNHHHNRHFYDHHHHHNHHHYYLQIWLRLFALGIVSDEDEKLLSFVLDSLAACNIAIHDDAVSFILTICFPVSCSCLLLLLLLSFFFFPFIGCVQHSHT